MCFSRYVCLSVTAVLSAAVPAFGQTCSEPASAGVNVCSPGQGENVTPPVTFIAAGTGASGSVNHLELWIDGTKIGNYSGSTMDASVAEAVGSHTATVIEVDSKGDYVKSAPVTYAVGETSGGCTAPSSPGVSVCEPAQGSAVASPVKFDAAGTGASGAVNHLELWIDGTKIGNYSGDSMDTNVTVATGSHAAQVVEVDSEGDFAKSPVVDFTVSTTAAVAWLYAGNQEADGYEPPPPQLSYAPIQANGNTGSAGSVNLPEYVEFKMAANGSYLFVPFSDEIDAFSIQANGSLKQAAITKGGAQYVYPDRTGKTLYEANPTSLAAYSIGANGSLTLVNKVSADFPTFEANLSFTANNAYAYSTYCNNGNSPVFYGFSRASNGALTEFNPQVTLPAAPSCMDYCPFGAATPDSSHVVIALDEYDKSNQQFVQSQLAVYTIESNGTLKTANTSSSMPTLASNAGAYAFDPTGTWLAMGTGDGLNIYKFSDGTLTFTDSVSLYTGVVQLSWDKSGHVYVVGQTCCGGTAVYNVSSEGKLTPAPDDGTYGGGLGGGLIWAVQSAP